MKIIYILVFIIFLSGCAATGPLYKQAPDPEKSDSLIYLYRPSAFALGARDSSFYINDVNIADLSNEGYTWFHFPSGEYALKQKWPYDVTLGKKDIVLNVKWEAGKKYYYVLDTTADIGYNNINFKWIFSQVKEEEAQLEITSCKLQPVFDMKEILSYAKNDTWELAKESNKSDADEEF